MEVANYASICTFISVFLTYSLSLESSLNHIELLINSFINDELNKIFYTYSFDICMGIMSLSLKKKTSLHHAPNLSNDDLGYFKICYEMVWIKCILRWSETTLPMGYQDHHWRLIKHISHTGSSLKPFVQWEAWPQDLCAKTYTTFPTTFLIP